MTSNATHYSETRNLRLESVLALYRANGWSAAEKPDLLYSGLLASHALVTAWHGPILVGLGNTLSDGHLVVYYSHLLVLPEYQGRGIGTRLMQLLMAHYQAFHQHILVADGRALDFYRKCGFQRAGKTDRKSTRLNSSHSSISYAVFCLKKKKTISPALRSSTHTPVITPPPPSAASSRGSSRSCFT